MLSGIDWKDYIYSVLFLMIGYYGVIGFLYYRQELLSVLKNGFQKKIPANISPVATESQPEERDQLLFSIVHDLMEDLKKLFKTAADKHYPKQELLIALQGKFKACTQLKGTAFQVAINNHILQQAALECQISLDETDLKNCWAA
jgi:hypothetical protein